MMKITGRLAAAPLATAALGLSAALPALADQTLSYSAWTPPTHHLTTEQQAWAKAVEKATDGRVKFRELPKAPASPSGTFDAVRDSLVDLSFTGAAYTPGRHVLTMMAELPGGADSAEIQSVAYSRIHWKYFQKVNEYKGVKLLAVWAHPPGQMFTKKPIKSLADFKGLKIRTGGGVSEQVITALGGSPLFKPAPEAYELLSSGVADGIFFPFEAIGAFKLEKVISDATIFPGGLYSSAFGFFMNQEKWNGIPQRDQAIIEKHSHEYAARLFGETWDKADAAGLAQFKNAGDRITNASPELVAEARKHAAPIVEKWIKDASAKGVDARRALDEFHAEIKKLSARK